MTDHEHREQHEYTVGAVAELAGVSVRTLHHYDEAGLLEPSRRSPTGYRLYAPEDLARLQRILFYRELGVELATIAGQLDVPGRSDVDLLHAQRAMLAARADRYTALVAAVDRELAARDAGIALTPEERLEVFGRPFEDDAARARARFGDTGHFRQRRDRTAGYTKEDWLAARTEQAGIHQRLLDAMTAGTDPAAPEVADLAEEHRRHLHRWFHDCDHAVHAVHAELAGAYLRNERVGRNYDDMAPGLSRYVHDAIMANAARNGHRAQ